ncbi:5'-3' exoribonuclease 2 homolog [Cimex lectularius]|uniref:5'-3' exoribonuclease n=1 Tax=Cimex lectularius TaxID=79782 RepID=A0A8I6THS1_CIMLE|nr:5'-3' exoribonuclease 2 homolog [Cimex lectularius]
MGVPAFFRWLTRKYPSVVVECVEEMPKDRDGEETPVDSSEPNPNGVEFDNLYLDMNGIIHPCTHPENKPAPKNEDEMMVAIFECIDRLFKIVRPRKILYLAIDGVAPRAKMNQQRSRRFRAAKEATEKAEQMNKIRTELLSKGYTLPPEKECGSHFDSNCITPGTGFMARLTQCLNYYIHERLMTDPGWKGLKVILSDASVPGEGEHKIMDFIRRQRALPNHDPNTHHCLCGADADLIMLGLATHEPNFTIIREEFQMNQPKKCDICSQPGHEMKDCKGLDTVKDPELCNDSMFVGSGTKYIFVRLNVLREYLEEELKMPDLPFEYNFERALDDWVFMCFFVGNDFLPHLPSLEIREGAIDRLINLYKKTVYKTRGFLTDSGDVDLERVHLIMSELGEMEDEIFKRRQKNELSWKLKTKQREMNNSNCNIRKSYAELMEEVLQEETGDDVKLYEEGYKDRYYKLKFGLSQYEIPTREKIGWEYVKGLCWVLKYYYQGCVSWNWYFPYHYAPFASDIVNNREDNPVFPENTTPFSPLEQLMGVFPAASGNLVPPTWAELMTDPCSPILDFYPKDFMIDLNGKKYAWQGVALLPFVDEQRLKAGLKQVYGDLTEEERERNMRGNDRLYINIGADCFDFVKLLNPKNNVDNAVDLNAVGIQGKIFVNSREYFQGKTVWSPVPGLEHVKNNSVLCVAFVDPKYPTKHKFMANRLDGAVDPPRTLKSGQGNNRPMIGFVQRRDRDYMDDSGHRMIHHNLPPCHSYIPLGPQGNPWRSGQNEYQHNRNQQQGRGNMYQGRMNNNFRGRSYDDNRQQNQNSYNQPAPGQRMRPNNSYG